MMTVPYLEKYKKAMSKEIIKEDELEAVTNKGMYSEWLKLEPEPRAVLVEVDKPWPLEHNLGQGYIRIGGK